MSAGRRRSAALSRRGVAPALAGADRMSRLIDRYNALSVPDQLVVQAQSALLEPASARLTASCLVRAGRRESHLRAFSPQIVQTRLACLAREGLIGECSPAPRDKVTRLWSCHPVLGEIALRHAARDGLFLPLAKAVLEETREAGEDATAVRRRFRLAFHAGDWGAALREFAGLAAKAPGAAGNFLVDLASRQPDSSWRRGEAPAELFRLLAAALRDLPAGWRAAEPLDRLAAELLARPGTGGERGELALALANLLILRGDMGAAVRIAGRAGQEYARRAILLALAVAGNERDDASTQAEAALAAWRLLSGTRDPLLPDCAGVWQVLAAMSEASGETREVLLRRLSAPNLAEHAFAEALSRLRRILLFMDGRAFADRGLADCPPNSHPLTALAQVLAVFQLEPERPGRLAAFAEKAAIRARGCGCLWLTAQFLLLAGRKDAIPKLAKWRSLADPLRDGEGWLRSLLALEDLGRNRAPAAAGGRKRLAWLVNFPRQPRNPFVPVEIQPVEQSLGRDGSWSRGRGIALRRIFRRAPDLDFAGDQDRLVFSAVRWGADEFSQDFRLDAAAAAILLIGHPLVFRGDAAGVRLEVAAGELELSVTERDGGCEIGLEPAWADFFPAGAGPDAFRDAVFPEVAAKLETPTRLRVFRLGERERRLAGIIGGGLAVPARGRSQAVQALSALSGGVRLQSDLPELAGEGELAEADPLPRFHVLPQHPGLRVEVWSHPLGSDGPACRIGRGGRMFAGSAGGRQLRTVRDPAAEKRLAEEAAAACPSLSGRSDGDFSWRLEDPEDALSFLSEAGELGEAVRLVWPKGGQLRMHNCRGPAGLSLRVRSSAGWFEVDGELRVDEQLVVGMEQLLAACQTSSSRFVELGDGEYLALTGELRRQLADLAALGEARPGGLRLSELAGGALEELEKSGAGLAADAAWRRGLERRRRLAEFNPGPPEGFKAELRDYQLEGYRWLARLAEWGVGACLADDMGLGKTIQALAILVRRAELGPALVVAPTSVCHNWLAEAGRFAPSLRLEAVRGPDRAKQLAGLGPGEVLIASYNLLRQEEELFAGVKWATAVLDEAQAIKNFAAGRSRAAMSLDAGFRLITTGTPIENHLGELWSLFRFINPNLLGSFPKFQRRFAAPIERGRDKEAGELLRRVIRPFVLRRTKAQVLASLPPKTEITLSVELGERERAFYESLRRGALERIDGAGDDRSGGRSVRILAEITRLRRACCSPELIPGGARVPSAKQEQFRATLAELLENRHKALVFSQFVDHLSIIRRHLDAAGYSYQYLDGSTPPALRKKAVDAFQSGQSDVFLLSLKAGGLGLNLTAADYVIHMDPWWNPAVEDQASDRAHRIGQDRPVTVYRLTAAGTIEEKIVQLHRDKRDLADSLLAGAEQAAGLDMEEMLRLLRED